MKVLITIPHIFNPKKGSPYSSQNEEKRQTKVKGLAKASIENMYRHSRRNWVHASLGYKKKIVTRETTGNTGVELTIQVYTKKELNLIDNISHNGEIEIYNCEEFKEEDIPLLASRRSVEQADKYDIVGYIEDDILIEDNEFFEKLMYLYSVLPPYYALMPHRCEFMNNKGYVILSGDPDGQRNDLFWATGEKVEIDWPTGKKTFYRATNPHSGCYFLSRVQADMVNRYWSPKNWASSFVLSGPLEQAASGILLPILKIMKPIKEDYKFLMVSHQDELWKRHNFENI